MDDYQIIAERFQGTIESIAMSVDALATPISRASELMTQTLLRDGKIITCGNGVDAAQAQLFTAAMLCTLEQDRPPLPALQLGNDSASLATTAGADSEIYARQLQALGQEHDTLLLINSADAGAALVEAVTTAHNREIPVIALSTSADTKLPGRLRDSDELLLVEAATRSQTIELHTMTMLCFCQLIEHRLFGGYTGDNS